MSPNIKGERRYFYNIIADLNASADNKGNIHISKLYEHLNYILPNSDDASKLT